ncbi:hypothetical protein SHI21_11805 [Bacteriovorax sp. PP10]|uniref:Lipoprotein n=1 Tax=Bacteriovorax antarcticus TaxID=3088717 RepID=A0ABU5VV27_9BACT|nr:hypothetical protein [Bacteriovorax sp. PP10]MEA9356898.1 hypothetical protein [Bacteriovorax sp. PP10]
MNFNKKLPTNIRIAISMGTLVVILFAFNQCVAEKKTNTKKSKSSSASTSVPDTSTEDAGDIENEAELPDGLVMPPINAPVVESEMDAIDVGVKNFEQILISMSEATGVSAADTGIQSLYKELSVQLPADNNIKSFLPANQVAITKLAAEFCEKLVETQDLRVVVWPTINFNQSPTQVFNATNKQLIITQAITRFLPPMEANEQTVTSNELSKLFDDLLTGENLGSSVTTKKIVKGMCISTLASAHATFL